MPMARHAIPDRPTFQQAQGGERRRRPVAPVVVRLSGRDARPQQQQRSASVRRMNLALLVHCQHPRLVRGIRVEPDGIPQLLDKALVAAELEGLDATATEIMLPPDPANADLGQLC